MLNQLSKTFWVQFKNDLQAAEKNSLFQLEKKKKWQKDTIIDRKSNGGRNIRDVLFFKVASKWISRYKRLITKCDWILPI